MLETGFSHSGHKWAIKCAECGHIWEIREAVNLNERLGGRGGGGREGGYEKRTCWCEKVGECNLVATSFSWQNLQAISGRSLHAKYQEVMCRWGYRSRDLCEDERVRQERAVSYDWTPLCLRATLEGAVWGGLGSESEKAKTFRIARFSQQKLSG